MSNISFVSFVWSFIRFLTAVFSRQNGLDIKNPSYIFFLIPDTVTITNLCNNQKIIRCLYILILTRIKNGLLANTFIKSSTLHVKWCSSESEDQIFLIDVYIFKYWQALQPIQMSVGAIFDEYGNCIGFSREVLESGHVSLLKLPRRWREPSTQDTGLTLKIFLKKQNNKNTFT